MYNAIHEVKMKQSSPSPPRWDQSGQMCVCISLRYQSRPSLVGQGNNGIHGTISIGFLSHMFCERDNHLAWIIRTFNSLPMWPSLWGPYCSTYITVLDHVAQSSTTTFDMWNHGTRIPHHLTLFPGLCSIHHLQYDLHTASDECSA